MGIMSKVLIFGSGVIGMSFARRFMEAGWDVNVFDVNATLKDEVEDMGARFFTELEPAARGVDFVQESGPESLEFKQDAFRKFAQLTGEDTILASSTSAILPSLIAKDNPAADRIIVGHPFAPPNLMPVLEVVPGEKTSEDTMQRALQIYEDLGFEPTRLNKEILGFVGNRIQKVILWEGISLVQQGVISAVDFDTLIKNSLGLRYAVIGPFEANRLGGGPKGISSIFDHIAGAWDKSMPAGTPDIEHLEGLFAQVDEAYGNDEESYERLSRLRDRKLRAVVEARKDPGDS